jgi:hypothetical protein
MATPSAQPTADPFRMDRYVARRKVLTLFAPMFHIYGEDGSLVCFVKQKAFKLKEDIRLYSDESMSKELLLIQARQIIDFSAAYDVVDSHSSQKVGALKRRGWKSILQDEWILMDTADNEIGRIKEDSALLATIRRFLTNLIPQTYKYTVRDTEVGMVKQAFNPFVLKCRVDFSADPGGHLLDRRLALASVILLLAIEGRQQ